MVEGAVGYRSFVHATGAECPCTSGIAEFVAHGDYRLSYGQAMHPTRLCALSHSHADVSVREVIGLA
jgi:hypothetical protein